MSDTREKRLKILFTTLLAAFTCAVTILAFMQVGTNGSSNAVVSAVKLSFDMFKSIDAFKAWLAAVPYYYYVFIGLGLLAFSILMVVLAVCKKARFRRNDVNVLIMVGESEDKVDATVFKEHYAVVVVSKPSSMVPVKPKALQSVVPLEDDRRFIPIPNEDPNIIAEIDEESTSVVEEVVFDENSTVYSQDAIDEVTKEVVAMTAEDVVEEKVQPTPQPTGRTTMKRLGKKAEEVPAPPVEEPKEQPPITVADSYEVLPEDDNHYIANDSYNIYNVVDDEMVFAEEQVASNQNAAVSEPQQVKNYEYVPFEDEPEIEVEIDMDEVFDQVYADADAVNAEEEALYNDSEFATENFEEVGFDMNELNVTPIVVSAASEDKVEDELEEYVPENVDLFECVTIDEDKVAPSAEEETERANTVVEVAEFEPQVFVIAEEEEIIFAPEDTFVEEATFDDIALEVAEEAAVEVAEELEEVADEVEELAEEVVDEVVEYEEEVVPLVIIPVVSNKENASAKSAAVADIDDEDRDIVAIIPAFAKSDDLAYSIIKQENATQDAIDDFNNGALIVDADGDGIVDEVLEDKSILKMRYKTIDMDKRLRRTDEDVKGYYSDIKNALLAFNGVKSRVSKKFDTFTLGRFIVAKVALRGKVINLYLALPNEQVENKYFAEDVSDSETYGKTPTLHKVKSKRGCKYGVELIQELMNALAIPATAGYQPTDYVAMYPPENIDEKKAAIADCITDRIFIDDTDVLSDEEAVEFVQIVKNKEHTINKFNPINKYVAYIDDVADLYEDGEIVTIDNLIEKGALPKEDNLFLEIRAKGTLDKCLTVEAHSFDIKAVKMITLTNGNVIQHK